MAKFGIDFGTTNSSIAVSGNGDSRVVEIDMSAKDPRVVRSMLYFNRRELVYGPKVTPQQIEAQVFKLGDVQYEGEQTYLIGQEAVGKYLSDNKNRQSGVKRKIFTGRWIAMKNNPDQPKTDPMPEYYEEIDYGTGRLLQALKSSLKTHYKGTTIFGKFYPVEELVGMFVKDIKEKAERELGKTIDEITIGRPVKFSEVAVIDQRTQDRLAFSMRNAGFKKLKFEYEPVGAAKQFLAGNRKKQTILVFDFGGGTLDTAIVKMGEKTEVLATDGVYIGGDLLNADIMEAKLWNYFGAGTVYGEHQLPMPLHIYEALNSWFAIPSLNNPDTMDLLERTKYKNSNPKAVERLVYLIKSNVGFELYEAIERAKKELSESMEARIIYNDGPIELDQVITRDEFEKIIAPRVGEIRQVVLKTLESAKMEPAQIDVVVRTGGSSLIPIFERMLEDIFGKEKITLFETFTSIAAGLALD